MLITDALNYSVLERTHDFFQVLWLEFHLHKESNVICRIPSCVLELTLQDEALERYDNSGKPVYVMGNFKINLLTIETCNLSKDFLISIQSNSCLPIIGKLTWVYKNSVTSFYNVLMSQIKFCVET